MAVFDFIKDAPARGQTEDKRLAQIPIQRIQPNPNQPRHTFDEESIAELAQSIRQVGLIQPLIVPGIITSWWRESGGCGPAKAWAWRM